MSQTVLTSTGFKRKRYVDFVTEMQDQARTLWGADVNLSDNSPLGKFIKNIAYARADENELSEAVYYSAFYDTAEGVSLDYVAKGIAISRIQANKATGQIKLTVTAGITVAAGVIVATTDGLQFVTTAAGTDSDNDGFITVDIEAMATGPQYNVPSNTITVITTPTSGVTAATNPSATINGRNQETDSEFRNRYALSVAKGGSSTLDSIRAALLNDVTGLTSAIVLENKEDTTVNSIPPHSIHCIVLGGNSADVAQTILQTKAGGIRAYGSQSVTVADDSGNNQTIGFSYATQVNIYVHVTVTTNSSFPTTGADDVELAVIKYIGGTDANGNSYTGLSMGDDVITSKIIRAVMDSAAGIDDVTVTTSKDNVTFSASNISIAQTEVVHTDSVKVVVTVA